MGVNVHMKATNQVHTHELSPFEEVVYRLVKSGHNTLAKVTMVMDKDKGNVHGHLKRLVFKKLIKKKMCPNCDGVIIYE